jgi:putative SOS response-associated peptidase YedK
MCSRYNLTSPPEAVRAYFGYGDTPNFPARYNIAPTQAVAVVARDKEGMRRFRLMRWGLLPAFVKDPKQFPTLINARSEEVLEKPSFRNAMRYRRCLVPADGFYEWTGEKGKRRPFLLRPREKRLIAFAGLYERWRDAEGGEIDTVVILTCAANGTVTPLHDRMPVVLAPEQFEAWLDVKDTSAEAAVGFAAGPRRSPGSDRDEPQDQRFAERRAGHPGAAAKGAAAVDDVPKAQRRRAGWRCRHGLCGLPSGARCRSRAGPWRQARRSGASPERLHPCLLHRESRPRAPHCPR